MLYELIHGNCRKLVGGKDEGAWGGLDGEAAKIGADLEEEVFFASAIFFSAIGKGKSESPLLSMSERLRDDACTASQRFSRLAIKLIGRGIFKSFEADLIRMILSAITGGSGCGFFILKKRPRQT